MDKKNFISTVKIRWSEEDDSYLVTFPLVPGLSAFGDTVEEALNEFSIVLGLFMEEYIEDGAELDISRGGITERESSYLQRKIVSDETLSDLDWEIIERILKL